ncbi:hypothetical protein NQ314_008834 [Rhamnusium bicolor]|uniref:BESS domain-containing protein n=1 Tax=Rhamnusium bicolor TaxID=1586634 RepID=A0AAV8Y6W2_9CUCU|nr:hypothetical protein NQ314_008834 [Rhamnusium bicolor]
MPALNRLENITSAINIVKEEDEFHFFALNVAPQLRQLPLYEALGVQTEIQQIFTASRRRTMFSNIQPNTYSTLPPSNTQTNTLPPARIQTINFDTVPDSNTENNEHARDVQSQPNYVGTNLLT